MNHTIQQSIAELLDAALPIPARIDAAERLTEACDADVEVVANALVSIATDPITAEPLASAVGASIARLLVPRGVDDPSFFLRDFSLPAFHAYDREAGRLLTP